MGWGTGNIGGGSGAGLNLKVVGGTSRPGGGDTLTWDGNTEGRVNTLGVLFKLSDATPSMEDLKDGCSITYTVRQSGENETQNIPLSEIVDGTADGVPCVFDNDMSFVVVYEAFDTGDGFSTTEKGTYLIDNTELGWYVSSLTIPGYTGFGGGGVKNNTIWVNTDTAINGYAFSADEPASPAEGMVWFATGTSSSAAMNVDKKNTVMIYPAGCKQYVSGDWVSKTARSYINGAWVEWVRYLYRAGDMDTGFVALGWIFGSGATARAPEIDYGADSVVFTATTEQYGGRSGVAYFPNKVDLSQYSTLTADATLAGSISVNNRPEGLYIWSEVGTGNYVSSAVARALFNGVGDKILTIDVSELSGEYYIGFGLRYESTPAETITVREVSLK